MKNAIIVGLLAMSLGLFAQKTPNFPISYDLSLGDTILVKEIQSNNAWGYQLLVTNPDTTDAVVSIMQSSDGVNWFLFDAKFTTSLSVMPTIIATDTTYLARFSDDYWEANFIGIKIQVGSVTSGTLKGILTQKKY